MDDYITRPEHEEFCKRMDDEHKRQNRRIGELEEDVRQIGAIATSVEKLAVNMENMAKEQKQQGERLKIIEGRDGEMWRRVTGYIATAIVGILLGYIFTQIGM